MRRSLAVAVMLTCFGGALVSLGIPDAIAADTYVAIIEIDDAISPSTSRFLSRAIDSAADSGAVLLLVRLDTPGGLLDATRDMVDTITNAVDTRRQSSASKLKKNGPLTSKAS